MFVEDLDHRVGKGIISAVEFDGAGPKAEVFPVLEEPWHLSYPFLIEHDGDLWMIPESSQRRDVALYKCVRFPDKWERHSTLLSGFELADATITLIDVCVAKNRYGLNGLIWGGMPIQEVVIWRWS